MTEDNLEGRETIGRYEIVREIAQGGMAVVYLARDSYMDREVAIKVLPRHFLHDPNFSARFTREARIVAALEHPAIVPIYDFGYHEEQPFMVSRYMNGGSMLTHIKQKGAISVQEALSIVTPAKRTMDLALDYFL